MRLPICPCYRLGPPLSITGRQSKIISQMPHLRQLQLWVLCFGVSGALGVIYIGYWFLSIFGNFQLSFTCVILLVLSRFCFSFFWSLPLSSQVDKMRTGKPISRFEWLSTSWEKQLYPQYGSRYGFGRPKPGYFSRLGCHDVAFPCHRVIANIRSLVYCSSFWLGWCFNGCCSGKTIQKLLFDMLLTPVSAFSCSWAVVVSLDRWTASVTHIQTLQV